MSNELIKDKESYNPAKSTDKVLLTDHSILHEWWSTILKGKKIKDWSREDVYNAHDLTAKQMTKRKLGLDKEGKHDSPLRKSNYDQPNPADVPIGERLFLPSVLKAFSGDCMISEDFVTIVGGLCNHGATKGDIDILIKSPEPQSEKSPLGVATQLKLASSLTKLGIPEDRLQFFYDEFSNHSTNHVHVFDLILRLKPQRELHEIPNPQTLVVKRKPIKELSINAEVVNAIPVKGLNTFSYIIGLRDGENITPAGKTFNTNIRAPVGGALEVVFVEMSQNIDPKTKKLYFNMFAPRVVGKAAKADSVETAKRLVQKSGGQVQEKPFPTRFKGLLSTEEDDYIEDFFSMCLKEESDEFDISLSRDWIKENMIPDNLAVLDRSELRNSDNFILRKNLGNKSIVCLRDDNNKLICEKIVNLVEA